MKTFKELGLSQDILASLDELGFSEPTPIQARSIPYILKSKQDLIALAQTGTGKTAAYSLPIIQQIRGRELQAIILCPTRELCLQIAEDIRKFTRNSHEISVTPVYGGARIDMQMTALRRGVNIVVGTPGRVHDLVRRKAIRLRDIQFLVLDEADEMLDMGFKDDLNAILAETPKERQTLLFSATMSKSVNAIAMQYMHDTEEIVVGEKNVGADNVSHEYYVVPARERFDALRRILDCIPDVYGILFCRTRREAQEVAEKLKSARYDAEAIHGDVAQTARTKIMDRFRRGDIRLLVATDVAARGIDVKSLTHVINYNLPDHNEVYTHRSGRTGRAQEMGVAITLVTPREQRVISKLEAIIGKKFEYRKVPSGSDMIRKRIDIFFAGLETTKLNSSLDSLYLDEIQSRLEKLKKDELVRYIMANNFSNLVVDEVSDRDLNAGEEKSFVPKAKGEMTDLRIDLGKKQGMNIKAIFGLINSNRRLKGVEIGEIILEPEDTIISVERARAADVLEFLPGARYRGRRISVRLVDGPPAMSTAQKEPRKKNPIPGNSKTRSFRKQLSSRPKRSRKRF